jgi:hypothetical protein
MIELFLVKVLPEEFIFLHLRAELSMLEQLQMMESMWVATSQANQPRVVPNT